MTDMLADRIGFSFQTPAVLPQYGGRIKALATAGAERNSMYPEIPTFKELGLPGFEMGGWVGFFGPGTINQELVDQFNVAINTAMTRPAVAPAWKEQGFLVMREPAAALGGELRRDAGIWGSYFTEVGLEPQ